MNEKQLAEFRVKGSGPMTHSARDMTRDQVIERRAYIRRMLMNTYWQNQSNEVFDNIRILHESNGYLLEDTEGRISFIPGKTITEEETEFRKVRAMMPFEFMNLTGKDFDWQMYCGDITKSKDLVNNFIVKFEQFKKEGMGLYIESSVKGSGKTMLSCCILNELAKRYAITIKFINALDLLELTKQSYKGVEPEELTGLYQAAVLVIDDFGVQMSKEWVDTVFYRLINSRYNNKQVTIYTSNIPVQSLKMDDRITDRVESTTYQVLLPEESIRSQIRAKQKAEIIDGINNTPV